MDTELVSKIKSDFYTRRYTVNPELTRGLEVYVYAECGINDDPSPNPDLDDFYMLQIFLQVDGYAVRDDIIGVPFGRKGMDREAINKEMDAFVESQICDETFPELIRRYLQKEDVWEAAQLEEDGLLPPDDE